MVKKSKEEVMQEIDNMTEQELDDYRGRDKTQYICLAYLIADCVSLVIYTFFSLNGWINLKQLLLSPENIYSFTIRHIVVYASCFIVLFWGGPSRIHTKADLFKMRNINIKKNNIIFFSYLALDTISFILHLMPFSFAFLNVVLMILAHTIATRNYERDPNKKTPELMCFYFVAYIAPVAIISFFCNSVLSDLVNGLETAVNAITFIVGLIIFFPLIMILLLFF